MKKVTCPMCKGRGFLTLKGYEGKIQCPVCFGDKWIWKLDKEDKIWVEEMEYTIVIHAPKSLREGIEYTEMTVEEALRLMEKMGREKKREVHFCRHCFGNMVLIDKRLIYTL